MRVYADEVRYCTESQSVARRIALDTLVQAKSSMAVLIVIALALIYIGDVLRLRRNI